MLSQSACGFLILVVLGCVLPSILAAPSNAAIDREENELAFNSDRNDSTEIDKDFFTTAKLIGQYGCSFVKVAAGMCNSVRNGEIDEKAMLERSENEDLDKIDMNQVRDIVRKYGCTVIKAVSFACSLVSGK
ncbi:hypothetical protein GHT06_013382 [Daphnia sinensis]|uniref:Uncharacterized protein n=1 Tax=Daphnia sinensis TaxID=1820382 RepID=A0AAD5PQ00_9CRUS|nr:hypothetical protein GHT06_005453 [Daphnia sinensis]KAI9550981.1 hypothetical protein GHT06_005454 [Daphnia sinensis]KAI9550982.1 hypothetical protein GHT06_005455 [Daphnia sinensis]KAI9562407.1 hypothetical protein GHT06_013377 [Daphnia sinensis]KAI9562410.1 hypothetical protein GHT06_013380 [Daphnia sinensis]